MHFFRGQPTGFNVFLTCNDQMVFAALEDWLHFIVNPLGSFFVIVGEAG